MGENDELDEQVWAAEKRDFVADRRDDIAAARDVDADERENVADQREQRANEREAELDQWEQRLDARAVELGVPPMRTPDDHHRRATERDEAVAARDQARHERQQRSVDRDTAANERVEARQQREAAAPTTQLALAFAEIAEYLYEADRFDEVLTRIVQAAVATIQGCAMASVTARDDTGYRTLASSHTAAIDADRAQYAAGEGPCLDAIDTVRVYAPSFPDPRWPALAARPTESGVESVASYRLAPSGPVPVSSFRGSLNAYASTPDAFDAEAREIGLILAAHATVAAQSVNARQALQAMERQLQVALDSRDVIGQAKGILMERLKISPDAAFEMLRRSSQQLNIKLRQVAATLAETGALRDDNEQT